MKVHQYLQLSLQISPLNKNVTAFCMMNSKGITYVSYFRQIWDNMLIKAHK